MTFNITVKPIMAPHNYDYEKNNFVIPLYNLRQKKISFVLQVTKCLTNATRRSQFKTIQALTKRFELSLADRTLLSCSTLQISNYYMS